MLNTCPQIFFCFYFYDPGLSLSCTFGKSQWKSQRSVCKFSWKHGDGICCHLDETCTKQCHIYPEATTLNSILKRIFTCASGHKIWHTFCVKISLMFFLSHKVKNNNKNERCCLFPKTQQLISWWLKTTRQETEQQNETSSFLSETSLKQRGFFFEQNVKMNFSCFWFNLCIFLCFRNFLKTGHKFLQGNPPFTNRWTIGDKREILKLPRTLHNHGPKASFLWDRNVMAGCLCHNCRSHIFMLDA